MRKKVLFIVGSLQSGGVSKSVVNLLNTFDRKTYDTHLMILDTDEMVLDRYLPNDITIHTSDIIQNLHKRFKGVVRLIAKGHYILASMSIVRMILSRFDKSNAGILLAKAMPNFIKEEFNLIVDCGGQQQLYYMIDKLKGKKKVTFFHSDYSKWSYYYKADKKYFPKTDHIFTISQTCKDSLINYFPDCKDKISIFENISSPEIINKLALEEIEFTKSDLTLCSIGHISKKKGIDLAIKASEILKNKNIQFKWFFVGQVIDSKFIETIKQKGLSDNMIFTGIKSNPYPYIKACDIYVHPSRFEGKSIALDEAKILCKPIVVTNFSTVNDQFQDRVNASICQMNGLDLSAKILELYKNESLRAKYVDYLSHNITDNSNAILELYKYIN